MTKMPPSQRARLSWQPLAESVNNSMHFWEPRRILYNLTLAANCFLWLGLTWPHFRAALNWQSFKFIFVFALLANLCYCAAYLADVPVQWLSFRGNGRRWRWGLWLAGTILAVAFANYWIADEIYPFVR